MLNETGEPTKKNGATTKGNRQTSRRKVAFVIVYGLCGGLFFGCQKTSGTNQATTANQPQITVTSNQATPSGAAAPNATPLMGSAKPAAQALPPGTLEANADLVDGGTLKLADYRGKIVVLDLWATWCGPCRQEVPHLVEIQKEFGDKGVQVIGLTTEDKAETVGKVADFMKEFNVNYKIGWASPEHERLVAMGGSSIPQTFILDGEGRVIYYQKGFSPMGTPPAMRKAIETALAAKV